MEEEIKQEKTEEKSSETPAGNIYVIKVKKKKLEVYCLTRPHGLRGYIFLEALDREVAEEAAFNLPYVKGIIGKTLTYEEIKNMIEPSIEEIKIEKNDI